jgi:hypothetical protein
MNQNEVSAESESKNSPNSSPLNSDNFIMDSDLAQLKKVASVNAIEAMVFYTGRVLEATSNYCVNQLGEKAKSNVFANIEYINDYNLLDQITRHWAHALRRLANQFRHILKPTEDDDGRIAIILLDSWLDWLVNRSHLVDKQTNSFDLIGDSQDNFLKQFQWINQWLEHKDFSLISEQQQLILQKQPVFASVICEELINRKEIETVDSFIRGALEFHPADLRLNQLKGLLLSRTGELDKAENLLRRLLKQVPNDDETVGILAGVIKKLWQNGATEKLSQWGKLYIKGWKLSKQRNTYLGINAATYALWSGDDQTSRQIAEQIVDIYVHRERILQQKLNVSTSQMDYWDHATLAEAKLLAGFIEQAEQSYHTLFHSPEFNDKPHEVPANQLAHHLKDSSIASSEGLLQLAHNFSKAD